MAEYVPLLPIEQVPTGKAVHIAHNGSSYIICNDAGTFYVADGICPHAGGPLANASVSEGCVLCPIHHWPWDLKTGLTDPSFPDMRLNTYACEVRSGTVFAAITSPPKLPELDCRA